MTTVIARRLVRTLMLVGAGMIAAAGTHAGPQVMLYVTLPLGAPGKGHVFGLRVDRTRSAPDVHIINPDSPLNRRALLDLQLGADSALRLELDRRLTWDFGRQQWRLSSRPATIMLRVPVRAPLAEPVTNQIRKPLVKALAVEP